MIFLIIIQFLLLLIIESSYSFMPIKICNNNKINNLYETSIDKSSIDRSSIETDLTGYTAFILFNGFDVKNMTALISFENNKKTIFSGGIDQTEPGFWRIIKKEDGTEIIEATHMVLPEYMFFYDTEKTILWKGTLDMKSKRIINGQVITNKKRFGLFSYEKELAKFEGNLIEPGGIVPIIEVPDLSEVPILPPGDFLTPFDMKLYPEIFDPEYVDWFFACEEALALGQTPPPRPKVFWAPKASSKLNDVERQAVENEIISKGKTELRSGNKSLGKKGKGF